MTGSTPLRRYALCLGLVYAGCASPTAPTATRDVGPPAPEPVIVRPPVTPTPPAPNPLLSDPRFSLEYYRLFALGGLHGGPFGLRRQQHAPRIYLRTHHDTGRPIDAATLDATAAALINTTGTLTGVFGLAGIEMGPESRVGHPGWITVIWTDDPDRRYCGRGVVGGDTLWLYTNTDGCRCAGGPQVSLSTVKHELGHVLGFWHTRSPTDLMFPSRSQCDQEPSEQEIFHARVAYSQPLGSTDPR